MKLLGLSFPWLEPFSLCGVSLVALWEERADEACY